MTSSSLIDDISEELLACRICLEPLRRAKTLSCRHTFCEVCLERLRDSELSTADDDELRLVTSRRTSTISRRTHSAAAAAAARLTCPVCYESCPLPPGGVSRLPDDPVVTQLYNVIERRRTATHSADGSGMCEICSRWTTGGVRSRRRAAHVKCVECSKLMCSHCARLHRRTNVTSGHSLLDVDDAELSLECEHHIGEPVRFYCDTCDVCVCVLCTYRGQPHSDDHDVLSFNDAVAVHQAPLTTLLSQCRQRLYDTRARHDAVVKYDLLIRKVEDNIHEVATETVSYIRRQERQLVTALREMCADDCDDEARVERKKVLSEHVRRLEDACDAADRLLKAISEGSGPAAFLLQRRRTVDAMTSLMTSQTTSATDWPTYERQVRFEAYGLESSLGLHVGRLVADDEVSDVEAGSQQNDRDDVSSAQQRIHAVTVPSIDNSAEWIEVKLSDMGVQTDDVDQSFLPSSRCEASGSVSASTTRLSVSDNQRVTTGTSPTSTRRRPAAAAAAGTLSEPVTSMCDASTSTAAVNVVSSSTVTERLVMCDQSTYTDLSSAASSVDQQTSTETLPDISHRSTNTDQLQTRSLSVTAAPTTSNKSTSTINDALDSTHAQLCVSDDTQSELIDVDKNLTQTTSFSTFSASTDSNASALETPHNYITRVDDSFLSEELPVTTQASTCDAPHLSLAAVSSADLTSVLNTGEVELARPSVRLATLLPEVARTADVLAASHFSSGLTARLLREIVDVGLRMTSSCGHHTQDAATDTEDHQTSDGLNAAPLCGDVKCTQTTAVCSDVVDVGVGQSVVTTSDASTLAKLMPITFDKETCTARGHQVNRSIATDSLSTADKQTWMPIDITGAYLASTAAASRRVLSVSRGTSTPFNLTAPSQPLIDRATSPVRVTLVDKSVTASKAEALEPVDTFQAPGQLSGPLSPRTRRTMSLSPRSKLACIIESAERYDEEKSQDLDDVSVTPDSCELFDASQTRSSQSALTSTQLPATSMSRFMQQPPVDQLNRNVFNFDHVVTSRFAALSSGSPNDNQMTSSSASANVADETVVHSSTYDVLLTESRPSVDNYTVFHKKLYPYIFVYKK